MSIWTIKEAETEIKEKPMDFCFVMQQYHQIINNAFKEDRD